MLNISPLNARSTSSLAALIACCGVTSSALAQGYSLTFVDSSAYCAIAVSGDGQVLAGASRSFTANQPAVWRKQNNVWVRFNLPVPAPGGSNQDCGIATHLSQNGDVIGGSVGVVIPNGTLPQTRGRPAVWTNVLSGAPTLTEVGPAGARGYVGGLTADGAQALLQARFDQPDNRAEVWKWTASELTRILPANDIDRARYFLPPYYPGNALSNDGSKFIYCFWDETTNSYPAFQSDFTTTIQLSGGSSGIGIWPRPVAISGSGNMVVGDVAESPSVNQTGRRFTWRQDRSPSGRWIRPLRFVPPNFPPNNDGALTCVSDDGQVFAGVSGTASSGWEFSTLNVTGTDAVLWINGSGYYLGDYLARHGVTTPNGVRLASITGMSDDGGTFVGQARNAQGEPVSFVATINPPGVCDDIDFNRDGSRFDPLDIDAFLSVFSEGPCLPAGATCNDVDFNNDGSLFDPEDIDAFLSVFGEGPCNP
jgi:uncharacterized membrane protein